MKNLLFIVLSFPLLGSVANIRSGDKKAPVKRNLELEKAWNLSKAILSEKRANKRRAVEDRENEGLLKKQVAPTQAEVQEAQKKLQEQQRTIQAQQQTIDKFSRLHEEDMNGLGLLFQQNDNLKTTNRQQQATIHEQQGNLQTQQGTIQAQQGAITALECSTVASKRRVGELTTALVGTRVQGLRDQQKIQKQQGDLAELGCSNAQQKSDLVRLGELNKDYMQTLFTLGEASHRLLENWEATEMNQGPGTPRTPRLKRVDGHFTEDARSLLAQVVEACTALRR